MRNLSNKSHKVPNLKKALKRFHQSQGGRNPKPLSAKLTAEALLREENKSIEVRWYQGRSQKKLMTEAMSMEDL